jgi:hypothetical protein
MVKNSSKNNRKHVGKSVKSKRVVNKYAKGAAKLGWNPKNTVKQNLEASGLATALNDHASIIRHRGLRLSKSTASEFLAMVDGQDPAPERGPPRTDFFMKDEEVLYLQVRLGGGAGAFWALPPFTPLLRQGPLQPSFCLHWRTLLPHSLPRAHTHSHALNLSLLGAAAGGKVQDELCGHVP